MLEHERIREEACGCRYDVATGLYVFLCQIHDGLNAQLRKRPVKSLTELPG